VAFELQLRDGSRHAFGQGAPAFRIRARTPQALPALASLDLGRIADAYLDAAFDVEGAMIAMYDLRPWLSDFHPLHYLWRFVQPLAFGQVGTNARAIRSHYDLGADFYLAFVGGARCYTQGIFEHPDESLETARRLTLDADEHTVAVHRLGEVRRGDVDVGPLSSWRATLAWREAARVVGHDEPETGRVHLQPPGDQVLRFGQRVPVAAHQRQLAGCGQAFEIALERDALVARHTEQARQLARRGGVMHALLEERQDFVCRWH
jgi:hypothetical protein